jgi:hypothetical protein
VKSARSTPKPHAGPAEASPEPPHSAHSRTFRRSRTVRGRMKNFTRGTVRTGEPTRTALIRDVPAVERGARREKGTSTPEHIGGDGEGGEPTRHDTTEPTGGDDRKDTDRANGADREPVRAPGPAAGLSEQQRATIRAAIAALPPMSNEQVDSVCEVIIAARERWRREDHRGEAAAAK